mmetsp:Transcript_9616/g.20494  ORF Transcript_9616/g.20494 Transcript_9616/m.20494 type:complete len:329 (+) Transcript_9616:957-1943(+)
MRLQLGDVAHPVKLLHVGERVQGGGGRHDAGLTTAQGGGRHLAGMGLAVVALKRGDVVLLDCASRSDAGLKHGQLLGRPTACHAEACGALGAALAGCQPSLCHGDGTEPIVDTPAHARDLPLAARLVLAGPGGSSCSVHVWGRAVTARPAKTALLVVARGGGLRPLLTRRPAIALLLLLLLRGVVNVAHAVALLLLLLLVLGGRCGSHVRARGLILVLGWWVAACQVCRLLLLPVLLRGRPRVEALLLRVLLLLLVVLRGATTHVLALPLRLLWWGLLVLLPLWRAHVLPLLLHVLPLLLRRWGATHVLHRLLLGWPWYVLVLGLSRS